MRRVLGAGIAAWVAVGLLTQTAAAQAVLLDGPDGPTLPSITPAFTLRAFGFADVRPMRVTIQIATSTDFTSGVLVDSTFTTSDTIATVQVVRPLASDARVYWRARVEGTDGRTAESARVGPRTVPTWLSLVTPNSPTGNVFDIRRPLLVWHSARVTPLLGAWKYDVEITTSGRPEQGVSGIRDTTYRATADLQANTSYRWSVRATLDNGATATASSAGSFLIIDQPLPATTLLYQNFPNPFPSPVAFATCIWFDVAEPGARIALDVTDLRGNLVRTLIPGADGQQDFRAGQYGRGIPGASSNCDNRFVWDGTGNDRRTVAPGVYLLRFRAGRGAFTFIRMLFLGR
ncbi:MAG: hypothetical protein IPP90_11265 [Gemmatimonadaceae bacterium]|nr:hypothetical protein [Gemmatimonadaceae bacterium]